MKKYTFTLTVEEIVENNVVNSIIAKVIEEDRIKLLTTENNNKVVEEMKKVLNVIYSELTELLQPLNLTLSRHYRGESFSVMQINTYGFSIETMIGGKKEHSGSSKDAIYIRIYCPYNNGKLTFEPSIKMYAQDVWNQSRHLNFTTSENLIETFSKEIEKIYKNNLK
jgi:hypothetical protein